MKVDSNVNQIKFNQVKNLLKPALDELQLPFPTSPDGIIFNKPRDEKLKVTKSYSCNVLIKTFHTVKPKDLPFKDFIAKL